MQANRYMYVLCVIIINLIIADQEQDTMQARALVPENQAASTVLPSQPRKPRGCRKCGQPMKAHSRSQCPQESIDNIS